MSNQTDKKPGILSGTAWVGSSRLVVRFLGLCSTFVLARLLLPEDFGLVAVAMGIIGLLESFSEFGFNHALIRFQDADEQDYSTAWTLNFCRGVLLCVVMLMLAYPLSLLLNDDRLLNLFMVIACLPFIRGLENPRLIIFEKKLQFNIIFRVMFFTKLVGVLITVVLAFLWRSYWVLIVGMFVTDITRCLLSYHYAPCRVNFTVKSWRKLFGFSGWIAGAQMLRSLGQRLDPVILAAYATPHIVGVLYIARDLSNMTFVEVAAPVRRVLFPALSQYAPDSEEFLETYQQSVRGLFLLLAPVCLGFALTVPDLVPLVMGNQWLEVIVPIQTIMIFLTISIVGQMSHSAAMAKGNSRPLFFQSLFLTPLKLLVYFYAVANYGLKGAIFSICLDLLLSTSTDLYIGIKATGISFVQHFKLIRRSLVPLLVMCLSVFYASQAIWFDISIISLHFVRLVILIFVGIGSYVGISLLLWSLIGQPYGPETKIINLVCDVFRKKAIDDV